MLKNMREFRNKIKNIWEWYVLGYYHCDKCPYSWEERNYEGDADAGCWCFGELRDTCRHIRNPISQLIVNKHRNEYECFEKGSTSGDDIWAALQSDLIKEEKKE